MEKFCKNCEHWERSDKTTWDNETMRSVKIGVENYGSCGNPKLESDTDPDIDGLSFMIYEYSSGEFRTGENFGCIQWAERQPEPIHHI